MLNDKPPQAVQATEQIRTSQSWDGVKLPDYLQGCPELVAVKYEFPAGQKLGWHHPPRRKSRDKTRHPLHVLPLTGGAAPVRAAPGDFTQQRFIINVSHEKNRIHIVSIYGLVIMLMP